MQITKIEDAMALLPKSDDLFQILGVRGYSGPNKIGVYDDALFLVSPTTFKMYKANTDPSVTRKGVAVLVPGTYQYKWGIHGVSHLDFKNPADQAIFDQMNKTGQDPKPIEGRFLPHWALRQWSDVTIIRDGSVKKETDGPGHRFYIDIHRGGFTTTSSLGCQTIHPDSWLDFRQNVINLMKDQPIVSYTLVVA